MLTFICVLHIEKMARPSQAITFPEVFIKAYGKPRGFYPSATPIESDIQSGSDKYGWSKQAKDSAMDGVRQTAHNKAVYLRGRRPFEALGLHRSRVGIRPNGIGTIGQQFEERPSLSGGIMFTKAGQDYIQKLLNARQKQYAEMGGESTFREVPTSNTDESIGESALNAVYPLFDAFLDDLRTYNVKSTTNLNNWWGQMLTTLPILGSNFRTRIDTEIIIPLKDRLDAFLEVFDPSKGNRGTAQEKRLANTVNARASKALFVLQSYIGEESQEEADNNEWSYQSEYNALFNRNSLPLNADGRQISYEEFKEKREGDEWQRGKVTLPQQGKAPIDAPANVREELVRKLNSSAGLKISPYVIAESKKRIAELVMRASGEVGVQDQSQADFLRPIATRDQNSSASASASADIRNPYESFPSAVRPQSYEEAMARAFAPADANSFARSPPPVVDEGLGWDFPQPFEGFGRRKRSGKGRK